MECPNGHGTLLRGKKSWRCEDCDAVAPLLDLALPAPVAIPLREFQEEPHPVLKLHRLCDFAEILTRFLAIVALGEVRAGGPLPDVLLAQLQPLVRLPTFGKWRRMLEVLAASARRLDPRLVPELDDAAYALLDLTPGGEEGRPESSLISLRNMIAHGGAMTEARAAYFLRGDPAQGFGGWAGQIDRLVARLSFLGECAVEQVAAEGEGRVGLRRNGRRLDLWPLCAHGHARMQGPRGELRSADPAPLVYFRCDKDCLLYAALGADLPHGESREALADFKALFRLDRAAPPSRLPDFEDEIQEDAARLVGRAAEVRHATALLRDARSGAFWVGGPGGIGKTYLMARLAADHAGKGRLRVAWRFKAGDARRCSRQAFFRHAVEQLRGWQKLRRGDVVPAQDESGLLQQLCELLDDAAKLKPGRGGEAPRVTFFLDGVDELARFDPGFPRLVLDSLQRGNVVWVCSGREEGALAEAFAPERCTHVFPGGLGRMSDADVRAMLIDEAGRLKYGLLRLDRERPGDLVANEAVEAVVARAGGLPLYVRLVIENVLAGRFQFARLAGQLPDGLSAYYDDLIERLAIGDLHALLTPLVVTAVWAREPLDEETLWLLMRRRKALGGGEDDLRTLREALRRLGSVLRQAALPGGGLGYEPYHDTFRHHVQENRSGKLAAQNRLAREEFAAMAAGWLGLPEGHAARRYALRQGPWHLADDAPHHLLALAQDERYLDEQARAFPDDPEAALVPLRAALEAAVRLGDVGSIVTNVAQHARRLEAARRQSPLDAARRGCVALARRLAALAPPEHRDFSRLLLLWELKELGRLSDAEGVRDDILAGAAAPRREEAASQFCWLLAQVLEDDDGRWDRLCEHLVEEEVRVEVDSCLLSAGKRRAAMRRCSAEPRAEVRLRRLCDVAVAQVSAGQADAAQATLAQAMLVSDSLPRHDLLALNAVTYSFRARAAAGDPEEARSQAAGHDESLGQVVAGLLDCGDLRSASWAAAGIAGPANRALALCRVAAATHKAGDVAAARGCLESAAEAAYAAGIGPAGDRAMAAVVTTSAATGDVEGALRKVGNFDSPFARYALAGVVREQAAGDIEGARQTALGIPDRHARGRALAHVAFALAAAGDLGGAWQAARLIEDQAARFQAFRSVPYHLALKGDGGGAARYAGLFPRPQDRYEAWLAVAAGFTAGGDLRRARESLAAAVQAHFGPTDADRAWVLPEVSKAFADAGLTEQATRVAAAIPDQGCRAASKAHVAARQIAAGDAERGRRSLAAAAELAWGCEAGTNRSNALAELSSALAASGDFEEARRAAAASGESRVHALLGVAEAEAAQGEADAAARTRAAALEAATSATDEVGRLVACRRVAKAQLASGDLAAALESLSRAYEPEVRSGPAGRFRHLVAAAEARFEAGDDEAARETLRQAHQVARSLPSDEGGPSDCGPRDSALRSLVEVWSRRGDAGGARTLAEDIDRATVRADTLLDLASMEVQRGCAEAARRLVDEAFQLARWSAGGTAPANFLGRAARLLADAGDAAGAMRLADSSEKAKDSVLANVVEGLASASEFEAAHHAACLIGEGTVARARALEALAKARAATGELAGARRHFAEAFRAALSLDGRDRATALRALAASQAAASGGLGEAPAGLTDDVFRTLDLVLPERYKALAEVADAFLAAGNLDGLKRLARPCADFVDAAARLACHLVRESARRERAATPARAAG